MTSGGRSRRTVVIEDERKFASIKQMGKSEHISLTSIVDRSTSLVIAFFLDLRLLRFILTFTLSQAFLTTTLIKVRTIEPAKRLKFKHCETYYVKLA